jgi:hypothetical protein
MNSTHALLISLIFLAGCAATHAPCPLPSDAGVATPADAGPVDLTSGTLSRPGSCQMVFFGFEAKRDGFAAVVDAPCTDLTWTCPWSYPATDCDPVLVEACFVAVSGANSCFDLNRAVLDCAAEACQ